MNISLLISSLPTQSTSTRMRVWRSIKSCGAATLRDGVYLLPSEFADKFEEILQDHNHEDGKAYIFHTNCPKNIDLIQIFDRNEEYLAFLNQFKILESELDINKKNEHLKQIRKLRKNLNHLIKIDYFPKPIQEQATKELTRLEYRISRLGEVDEPLFISQNLKALPLEAFQNKVWATRKRPWIDRLACAWLIQKFIDKSPQFVWLDSPSNCPPNAIGFDFDGATFTHIDSFITFEVLIHSFDLNNPALNIIAEIVHYLDVGGNEPPEAIGLEKIMHGLRSSIQNDDQLIQLTHQIFDGLFTNFSGEQS